MIIVVDTHFFKNDEIENNKFLSLFPFEENDGALRFNLDDLKRISILESEIVSKNIDSLFEIFLKNKIYPNKNYKLILRMYFVAALNVFIDRALRVLHLNRKFNLLDMKVMEVDRVNNFPSGVSDDTIGFMLTESGHSWQFNQEILCRILESLNVKKIKKKEILKRKSFPEYDYSYSYKNILFYPEKNIFFDKVKNKILTKLPKLRRSIPVFDMAYEQYYLKKIGIFGPFGLLDELLPKELIISEKNSNVRGKLLPDISGLLIKVVSSLLVSIDHLATKEDIEKIASTFPTIFLDYFPSSCFEAAENNVDLYLKKISSYKSKYIFGHGISGQNGIFAAVAAKMNDKKIVGYQHGGQYGYIEDLFQFAQTEYQNSDMFATWGWHDNEIDSHLPKFESFNLPAPLFSSQPAKLKQNYFKQDNFNSKPDIIFITNKTNRFPFSCSGGTNRIDFIDEFKSGIKKIVRKSVETNNSIIAKVYSKNRYELLKNFWDEVAEIGGENYTIYDSWDKGLSLKVINTAKIIVWDQIGTGTLQCLTSNIPSMVYWERFHSRETSFARPLIEQLEQVGIVHNNLDSLFKEIEIYKKDPILWINNVNRKKAIYDFCQKYAYTDKNWKKIWYKTLKEKMF